VAAVIYLVPALLPESSGLPKGSSAKGRIQSEQLCLPQTEEAFCSTLHQMGFALSRHWRDPFWDHQYYY